jgi:MoaA/NifB/PqqE/SkfB family radical SAM enzyme/SAM-dependent methyltransferase
VASFGDEAKISLCDLLQALKEQKRNKTRRHLSALFLFPGNETLKDERKHTHMPAILEGIAERIRNGYEWIEGSRFPIYLHPDSPFWFVPNASAHRLLSRLLDGASIPEALDQWSNLNGKSHELFSSRLQSLSRAISPPSVPEYGGRSVLELPPLSELWIHITDACNLGCRHCLFGCKPGAARSLDRRDVERVTAQAIELGCRLFLFTGGEPYVHPDFIDVLRTLLRHQDLRAAVLTNGCLIPKFMNRMSDLDRSRLHFQVSLDGPQAAHDRIRGDGNFREVAVGISCLRGASFPCSTVMAVHANNFDSMAQFVEASAGLGVDTVHFMWHFPRGTGNDIALPPMPELLSCFAEAWKRARALGVAIDNVEAIRSQVFTYPGTRFDLSNGGWESLAVGPDGSVFPTPAMVNIPELCGGHIEEGLETVWKQGKLMRRIRGLSLLDQPEMKSDPWRLILGGGDLDHCLHHPERFAREGAIESDPYHALHAWIARELIEEEAAGLRCAPEPGLVLRMGDVTTECPADRTVNFTHSNCLLSMGEGGTRALVREFYRERAEEVDESILNPVQYEASQVDFIPEEGRVRMYGCGSPVADAGLKEGEALVDLGSGSGVECFLAARAVGSRGRVVGLDMTDAMLRIAEHSRSTVEKSLGYRNTFFLKGYLEDIPIEDGTIDVVISNCVINLCRNKRKVFQEIFRILKPGGRFVISDVVCEEEPSLSIRADHKLTGECIAGAMKQDYLFAMLEELGFARACLVKRFPYRIVKGHPFFSLTFSAFRPEGSEAIQAELLYGGPFRAVVMEDGQVLERGARTRAVLSAGTDPEALAEAGIYQLDPDSGAIENRDMGVSACCSLPGLPEGGDSKTDTAPGDCGCCAPPAAPAVPCCSEDRTPQHESGCLICGAPLEYANLPEERACDRCGRRVSSDARCGQGHFVCDLCHKNDPVEAVKTICLETKESDMQALAETIRSHPSFSMHGPEHHALVPGVILATYRNLGGKVHDLQILSAIDRGGLVPGGACGFMGVCGAATGVGVAFAMLMGSNPLKAAPRQNAQKITAAVLDRIAAHEAARCCRRETHLALQAAKELSARYLPLTLRMERAETCDQHASNEECLGEECPLYPR